MLSSRSPLARSSTLERRDARHGRPTGRGRRRLKDAPRNRSQNRYKHRSTRRHGLPRERTTVRRSARTGRRVRNHTIPGDFRPRLRAMEPTAGDHRGAQTYEVTFDERRSSATLDKLRDRYGCADQACRGAGRIPSVSPGIGLARITAPQQNPAQVVLTWAVQRGRALLTTSVTPSRIQGNFGLSTIPEDAMRVNSRHHDEPPVQCCGGNRRAWLYSAGRVN